MAELADALDLGSSVPDVRVQVSLFAPYMYMILHKNGVFFYSKITYSLPQPLNIKKLKL